jgi:hypothetical protein
MSRLPIRKLPWARVFATGACLIALAVYSAFAPAPSYADPICMEGGCSCKCTYDGKEFSEGACRSNQTCQCIHGDTECPCEWVTGCN